MLLEYWPLSFQSLSLCILDMSASLTWYFISMVFYFSGRQSFWISQPERDIGCLSDGKYTCHIFCRETDPTHTA